MSTPPQPRRKKAKNPQLEAVLRAAEEQWGKAAVTGGSNSHYKVRTPQGMVSTSGSASDKRSWLNFRARLRQRGLND